MFKDVLCFFVGCEIVVQVFDCVLLDCLVGLFIVLIGLLGCGKFIMFCLVLGFDVLLGGMIVVFGQLLQDVVRVGFIGVVFQDVVFMFWCSVEDNIVLLFDVFGCKCVGYFGKIVGLIDFVGFKGFEKVLFGEFFGGMCQWVVIVCVFVIDLQVLFFDEFFGVFDQILC